MALLGDSIDPRLFLQDFSGFAKAGQTTANGIESAIGKITDGINDRTKEQKEAKNVLKASQAQIDAAINLFPDQAQYLSQIGAELKDEDTPLTQRAAIGAQTADFIAMAVGQKRYETDQDWKAKDLDLRRRDQTIQEDQSRLNQQITELSLQGAKNDLAAAEMDTATKATIGPALLDSVLAMAPAGIRKDVSDKIASGEYDDAEKYSLASSIQALIPKAQRAKAPTVLDVSVPGGKQQVQWDEVSGKFVPIQAELMQPEIILPQGVVNPEDGGVLPPKEGAVDGYGQPTESIPGLPPINGYPAAPPVGFTPTPPADSLAERKFSMEVSKEKTKEIEDQKKALASSEEMLNTLQKLESSAGFNELFGASVIPWQSSIPGSEGASAKAIYEQLEAKGFLEAIPAMKGMGALSEAEGAKLGKAYLGLSPNMKEADAKARIAEIRSTLKSGIDKARAKISGQGGATAPVAPADPYSEAAKRLFDLIKPK